MHSQARRERRPREWRWSVLGLVALFVVVARAGLGAGGREPGAGSLGAAFVAGVDRMVGWASGVVLGARLLPGRLGWALLALLALAALRSWNRRRAGRRPGPVDVAVVGPAAGHGGDGTGLAAVVRARMAGLGRGGSIVPFPEPLAAVAPPVRARSRARAGWSGVVVEVAERLVARVGHRVEGAVHAGPADTACAVTVAVIERATGRPEKVETSAASTCERAAELAADVAWQAISSGSPGSAVPPWRRWESVEGLTAFQDARRLEAQGRKGEALELYGGAATSEARNADVRLRAGALAEELGRYPEAVRWYRSVVVLWPAHLVARYRLAAALSLSEWETP